MAILMELFPVPLHSEELSLDLPKMEEYVYGLKKRNSTADKSNRGGWQSEDLIGEHPPLNDLREAILKHGEVYRKIIGYNPSIKIQNMWANINGYKDSNNQHTHPNSIISGCFYIKVREQEFVDGLVEFMHPSVYTMSSEWESNLFSPNQFNGVQMNLKPTLNQIIFFPSWLVHSVSPNLSIDEDRISIAFNLG